MAKRELSIASRITRLLAATLSIALLGVGVLLSIYEVRQGIAERKQALQNTAYVYAAAISDSLTGSSPSEIDKVFHSIRNLPDVAGVYALTPEGQVISSAGRQVILSDDFVSSDPGWMDLMTSGLMPVSVQVVHGGQEVGRLAMIGDISALRLKVLELIAATLAAAMLSLPLSMMVGMRLQRRLTGPIKNLTQAMTAVRASHEYKPAEVPGAEGETREMVETFNEMVEGINQRDKELNSLAFNDQLTGLGNNAWLVRHIHTMAKGDKLPEGTALLILDIAKFASFNATLGRSTADKLLIGIAQRLTAASENGFSLARLTGSAFAALATGVTSSERAPETFAPLIASLYKPFEIGSQILNINWFGGYAVVGEADSCNADELVRRTHLAVLQSKKMNAGQVVAYKPALGFLAEEDADIERGLHLAIAGNELEVHYQPLVSATNGLVEGFEALMRWKRPDGKMVPPGRFIPIAEQAGLIPALGQWILRRSCRDARGWLDSGYPPRQVSVNVSAAQLMVDGFPQTLRAILSETALPPELLCLELTESLFVGNSMEAVQAILAKLKSYGVLIALDDFGTGYSSLSYLERLSFDKLKLDRAFVRSDTATAARTPLLAGIIRIGRALGADVVAEGAETAAEVAQLKELGINTIQGFYYSKPMPEQQALARAAEIETEAQRRILA